MFPSTEQEVTAAKKTRLRREWIAGGIVLLVLLAGAAGGWYYYLQHRQPPMPTDQNNQYVKDLNQNLKEGAPQDKLAQAFYYSRIAYDYKQLKQWRQALDYYNRAEDVLDTNHLQNTAGTVFYREIGDTYKAKGDKRQAKKYYNKYIDFLKTFKQQRPAGAQNADEIIKAVQKQVNAL